MTDTVDFIVDLVLDQNENVDRFQIFACFLSIFQKENSCGTCYRFC